MQLRELPREGQREDGIMFLSCIILTLLTASFNVILSMLIEKGINISLANEEGNLYLYLVIMMAVVLGYFVLLFIKMNLQVTMGENKKIKIRKTLVKKALHFGKSNQSLADLSHVNKLIFYDSKIVSNRDKDVVFKFVEIAFSIMGGLAYLYFSNFYMGLASTLLLLVFYYFSSKYSAAIRKLSAEAIKIAEAVSGIFYDVFEASEIIKVYGGKGFFARRFEQGETMKEENSVRLDYKKNMLKAFTMLGIMTLQITAILMAVLLFDLSKNAGMIVGIINVLIGSIFYPLIDIQDVIIARNEYYNSQRRISEFIQEDSVELSGKITQELGEISKIAFDNVSVRYDQNCAIAYENFEFSKNEITAVYGESGTGKTTIANLILNRLQPEKGEIKVTDTCGRVRSLNGSLKVSYLSSSNNLLGASVADNIKMGNENISQEEVTDALKKLNLLDKINENPLGLSAVIGRDIDFSEGEKRRLCLIRAMLQAEDFVILDEPFASIDKENIKSVLEFISHRRGTLGIIIISHDKELDRIADRIYSVKGRKAV